MRMTEAGRRAIVGRAAWIALLALYGAVPTILEHVNVRDAFYAAQLARFGEVQPAGGLWPAAAAVALATAVAS